METRNNTRINSCQLVEYFDFISYGFEDENICLAFSMLNHIHCTYNAPFHYLDIGEAYEKTTRQG